MNRFLTGICLSGLLMSSAALRAQNAIIGRQPVRDAEAAFDKIFALPAIDTAYFFRANLPGDNFVTIRFNKLSYWPEAGLQEIVDIARLGQEQLRDSLSGRATAQRISLSVPPSNYPVVAALREHGTDQRILMLQGTGAAPVRIAHDTITVRRSYRLSPADTVTNRHVLYTFLLKDLREIEQIAADTALVRKVSETFDSLVAARRERWKKQDAPVHGLSAELDLRRPTMPGSLQIKNATVLRDRFDFFVEFGASALSTHFAGAMNAKISYTWQEPGAPAGLFAALSLSGLGWITRENNVFDRYYLNFLNMEYGFAFSQGQTRYPAYRTSVGFGYQVDRSRPRPIYDFQYRAFISYSLSRAVTLVTDAYFFRKNEQTRDERIGAAGLSVLLRFL